MHDIRREPAPPEIRDSLIIRFAGDSGDGMQLTGSRFTETAALAGNDVATFPDFPAEIRAPAGTIAGVSGFQLHFAGRDITTPGDRPDVLVAMNPAALRKNLADLPAGATIMVDDGQFTARNLQRAGFPGNPLEDGTLDQWKVIPVPLAKLASDATEEIAELTPRERERTRNFFALGLTFWMYTHSPEPTAAWIRRKFGEDSALGRANLQALQKGYDYGVTTEVFAHRVEVPRAELPQGTWRNITGNLATAYGFAAAAQLAERPLVFGSYPITPASDILHTLSRLKNFNVRTIQAEDEIAAICAAIGAAWGGAIGITSSSGPGIALKGEAMGLALMVELPLIVINVQRGGPSTGLPTKTEQSDLLQAIHGRHGESPMAVLAPSGPGDAFEMAIEAVRIATKYMTPVLFLSDGYIANSSEPWQIPDVSTLPSLAVPTAAEGEEPFLPYARDPDTLARPWATPGTPGLEHRVGGLEKADGTGHISYDPANHEHMVALREDKIRRIAQDIPPLEVHGETDADTLVIGWGSTRGAIHGACERLRRSGHRIAHAHLRHLNPLPANTGETLARYRRVLVPELNRGQLSRILRSEFLVPAVSLSQVRGLPFRVTELAERIAHALEDA
ncbi:MAG: 2-oxoacid:acceptor oxidoreductase subunit alpha [Deltaproteobacteria bacterium]|nr:MAG: 2-oxoacid:acceptor oxidoreductase subunit alpha [Deltaproteobacteria bacterium]